MVKQAPDAIGKVFNMLFLLQLIDSFVNQKQVLIINVFTF